MRHCYGFRTQYLIYLFSMAVLQELRKKRDEPLIKGFMHSLAILSQRELISPLFILFYLKYYLQRVQSSICVMQVNYGNW